MKRYADAREEFQAAIDLLESKGGAFFRAYVSEAYLGWAEATIKDRKADREAVARIDRKSTRLNSSHDQISYAVFCLKKKKLIRSVGEANQNLQEVMHDDGCHRHNRHRLARHLVHHTRQTRPDQLSMLLIQNTVLAG